MFDKEELQKLENDYKGFKKLDISVGLAAEKAGITKEQAYRFIVALDELERTS